MTINLKDQYVFPFKDNHSRSKSKNNCIYNNALTALYFILVHRSYFGIDFEILVIEGILVENTADHCFNQVEEEMKVENTVDVSVSFLYVIRS